MISYYFYVSDLKNRIEKYLAKDLGIVYILFLATVFCLPCEVSYAVEVGCAGSNRNPAACSLAECIARHDLKDEICNQPRSCRGVFGCAALKSKLALNQNCIAAREYVDECFFLPHPGHVTANAEARNAIATCERKIALPEPEGCADPCP